ncbi:MAG: carbon monoxide dehydrogenase [Candidatus Zixiibacteriota bacterium]|nr:MAG: carbon monoxide dehydrogenase [candidate division Zixibacteria bacterium]
MKIALTGKGGVGKTTLAALLAQRYAAQGMRVYAIDADPDANLASMLGVPDPEAIVPMVEMKALIKERVGATSQDLGTYFSLNPRVDDIPERYGLRLGNLRLLVLGHVPRARGGCACPENVFLRELVSHALTLHDEVVILDMEAGVEHLGRGTAAGVDWMLIVVEPSRQSLETAGRIRRLAGDLGVPRIAAVGNKIASPEDRAVLEQALPGLPFLAWLPHDPELRAQSLRGRGLEASAGVAEVIANIMEKLQG